MRTALITGASRGIGRGIAESLAHEGFGLTVTSRSADELADVSRSLMDAGAARVLHSPANLADRDALPALVSQHRDAFGGMDALILSGGVGTASPLADTDMTRADKTVEVNFMSALSLIKAALPSLRLAASESPYGARVIILASITGVYAEPNLAVYGATKAALLSITESLNAEESSRGVMATAIAPGYVATDMSAWTADRIAPTEMIQVSDVVSVVNMLLSLGQTTSIPRLVMSRSGSSGYEA